MIVLPNSFECYLNNLRIYTSFSILRRGLLPRHLINLRKIYLAEAFLYKDFKESVNIEPLTFNLLYCVKTIRKLDFHININQNVLINKNLYTSLILLLAEGSPFLTIRFEDGIIIKGKGEIKETRKIIAFLNGQSFFDVKTQNYLIYIPCKKTEIPPSPTVSQWELLFDRFSVFNLFKK